MTTDMMTVTNNPNSSPHWSLQNGYSNPHQHENYPYQVVLSGRRTFFGLVLNTFKNELEPKCSGIDQGYKFFFSTPGDLLQISQKYFRVPISHVNAIRIVPELTITTKILRRFQPNQRKCFYGDERQLRFFKVYTGINCKTGCMANFTKQECGCVHFSMPSRCILHKNIGVLNPRISYLYPTGDKNTQICGAARMRCMKEAKWKMSTTNSGKAFEEECNCVPACTFIKYNAYVSRSPLDVTILDKLGKPK